MEQKMKAVVRDAYGPSRFCDSGRSSSRVAGEGEVLVRARLRKHGSGSAL